MCRCPCLHRILLTFYWKRVIYLLAWNKTISNQYFLSNAAWLSRAMGKMKHPELSVIAKWASSKESITPPKACLATMTCPRNPFVITNAMRAYRGNYCREKKKTSFKRLTCPHATWQVLLNAAGWNCTWLFVCAVRLKAPANNNCHVTSIAWHRHTTHVDPFQFRLQGPLTTFIIDTEPHLSWEIVKH